jgi:hypothetical protein
MKRSEINQLIRQSKDFFREMNFHLPPWAFWKPEDWKGKYDTCSEIVDNMLGWDLTDFGSGDFHRRGLILFTIRNGNIKKDKKPYAEKVMIVEEMQETPMHFHWSKMEDIINRGGGNLVIELYASDENEQLSDKPFTVKTDGVMATECRRQNHPHPRRKHLPRTGPLSSFLRRIGQGKGFGGRSERRERRQHPTTVFISRWDVSLILRKMKRPCICWFPIIQNTCNNG